MTTSRLASPPAWVGAVVFILSGFAGLVYEATWSRYLKIILGHEAYAQALVLGIFLGGLAAGAALGGRFIHRINNPIVVYAVIESILALMAVYFHDVFVVMRSILEAGDLELAALESWLVATVLILPQAVMLGVTFPMLAAALTRWQQQEAGKVVAILYFANSFGGALGALAVGFFLVNLAGLPGAMYAGALASAGAGLLAWVAHHNFPTPGPAVMPSRRAESAQHRPIAGTLAIVALGTGLASLIYEVTWVRMLALVLGSSTRAFEIMLATFILGLALGGYFVRKRVDRPTRLIMLAQVQLLMGAFVIASSFYYEQLFNLLELVRAILPLNDQGYLGYGLASIVLGAILMLGPTFCAGMTLPLLTREAMVTAGEKALGSIYAWNTLGSIVGIVLTVHVLMPLVGLQHSLLFGAALDLALGIWLLRLAQPRQFVWGLCCGILLVVVASVRAPFDSVVLASGPYRIPNNFIPVSFMRHGKTASISIHQQTQPDGFEAVSIRTNGKSEGSLEFKDDSIRGGDVLTMMLSGALPLLYHHQARRAAIIGMGTGYTAATMLRSDILEELVTIEIEPAVLEATRLIPPSAQVYTDPRSRFAVIDAKTFFANQPPGSFDIIVSEPSNPWVSGLSSLFSKEHFELMYRSLAPDGILLQWFQLYESSPESMASILAAIDSVFPDYILYMMRPGDIAVITSPDRDRLNQLDASAWQLLPSLAKHLAKFDIHNVADAGALAIADRQRIKPYLTSFQVPANSDYFPILDELAAQGFYKKTYYSLPEVINLFGYLFTVDTLPGRVFRKPFIPVSFSKFSQKQHSVAVTQQLLDENQPFPVVVEQLLSPKGSNDEQDVLDMRALFNPVCNMDDEQVLERLAELTLVMNSAEANLLPQELARLWDRVEQEVPCLDELFAKPAVAPLLELFRASAVGDHNQVVTSTEKMLLNTSTVVSYNEVRALSRAMLANIALGYPSEAVYLGLRLGIQVPPTYRHVIRFVGAHAVESSDN